MVLIGSMGRDDKGEPKEILVRFTGIQPVPSDFLKLAWVTQLYAQPEGRVGRPKLAQVEVVSGMETYTTVEVPMKPLVTSALKAARAVLRFDRSERRFESLACFNSSAGFRVIITTTLKIATIARTTRSSINVKLLRLSF